MKDNITWVDNLKVIGILAVILGHIASPIGEFISSWHMPLFFMIAGFFMRFNLSIKVFIIKNFKRLMLPYFLFSFIGLGMETLKRIVLNRDSLDYIQELEGIFIWMDMPSLINTYAFVLWFLPTIFFAKVTLAIVNKYIKNILIQLIAISILFTSSFFIDLPFGITNAFSALLFLFIGNLFFRIHQESIVLYILPFMFVGIYFTIGIPSPDIEFKYFDYILISLLWSVSFVYILIFLLKHINYSNKLLAIWGGNTMLLFIIHPYTNNIAHIIVEKIDFGDWYLKFFISLLLLQMILLIKLRFENRGVFKYV